MHHVPILLDFVLSFGLVACRWGKVRRRRWSGRGKRIFGDAEFLYPLLEFCVLTLHIVALDYPEGIR